MFCRSIVGVVLVMLILPVYGVELQSIQLYGKLEKTDGQYRFTAFSTSKLGQEGWVDLERLVPAWSVNKKRCEKRLLGRGDCPKDDADLFRTSRVDRGELIFNTIITAGLKPIFGTSVAWTSNDREGLSEAIRSAVADMNRRGISLEKSMARFRGQAERLLAQYRRYHKAIDDAAYDVRIESELKADFVQRYPQALIKRAATFNWLSVVADVYDEFSLLDTAFEELLVQLEAGPLDGIGSLALSCGDTLYARGVQCHVAQKWSVDGLHISGKVSVREWHLPRFPMIYFELSGDRLAVQYTHGVIQFSNLTEKNITVASVAVIARNGDFNRKMIQMRPFPGGATVHYASPLMAGDVAEQNRKTVLISKDNLTAEMHYGVYIKYRYPGIAGERSSDLEQLMTVAEMMDKNLAFVSRKGYKIQDHDALIEKLGGQNDLGRIAYSQEAQLLLERLIGPDSLPDDL